MPGLYQPGTWGELSAEHLGHEKSTQQKLRETVSGQTGKGKEVWSQGDSTGHVFFSLYWGVWSGGRGNRFVVPGWIDPGAGPDSAQVPQHEEV